MIPVGFPAVKVTYLEKPQLKIISFKNYKHWYLIHSDKAFNCDTGIAIFEYRVPSMWQIWFVNPVQIGSLLNTATTLSEQFSYFLVIPQPLP